MSEAVAATHKPSMNLRFVERKVDINGRTAKVLQQLMVPHDFVEDDEYWQDVECVALDAAEQPVAKPVQDPVIKGFYVAKPKRPVADPGIKALYVARHGSDAGWFDAPGSYFISGVQAARAAIRAAVLAEASEPSAPAVPDAEALAQFIRVTDGNHNMGAASLAEAICEWLAAASPEPKS